MELLLIRPTKEYWIESITQSLCGQAQFCWASAVVCCIPWDAVKPFKTCHVIGCSFTLEWLPSSAVLLLVLVVKLDIKGSGWLTLQPVLVNQFFGHCGSRGWACPLPTVPAIPPSGIVCSVHHCKPCGILCRPAAVWQLQHRAKVASFGVLTHCGWTSLDGDRRWLDKIVWHPYQHSEPHTYIYIYIHMCIYIYIYEILTNIANTMWNPVILP